MKKPVTVETDSFAARIKAIRTHFGLTQEEFAKRINMSAPALSEIEKGKHKPSHDFFYNIVLEYDVNLYYLLFGKGEMFMSIEKLFLEHEKWVEVSEYSKVMVENLRKSKILQCYMLGSYFALMDSKDKENIEREIREYDESKKE